MQNFGDTLKKKKILRKREYHETVQKNIRYRASLRLHGGFGILYAGRQKYFKRHIYYLSADVYCSWHHKLELSQGTAYQHDPDDGSVSHSDQSFVPHGHLHRPCFDIRGTWHVRILYKVRDQESDPKETRESQKERLIIILERRYLFSWYLRSLCFWFKIKQSFLSV